MKYTVHPLLLTLMATLAMGQTTPYLGLNKPAHGSNVNTWDAHLNKNWDILDSWAARVTGGKWDIRNYGAVCAGDPGASNDTEAVVKALKAMGNTMGTLVIPDGCTWDPSQVPWKWKTYNRGNGHIEQLIELQGDTFVITKCVIPIDTSSPALLRPQSD